MANPGLPPNMPQAMNMRTLASIRNMPQAMKTSISNMGVNRVMCIARITFSLCDVTSPKLLIGLPHERNVLTEAEHKFLNDENEHILLNDNYEPNSKIRVKLLEEPNRTTELSLVKFGILAGYALTDGWESVVQRQNFKFGAANGPDSADLWCFRAQGFIWFAIHR
ncbi:hypothetical protein ACE6H2_027271 [Prunus campanulata]